MEFKQILDDTHHNGLSKTKLSIMSMSEKEVEYVGVYKEAMLFGKWWKITFTTPSEVGQMCNSVETLEKIVNLFEDFKVKIRQTGVIDYYYRDYDFTQLTPCSHTQQLMKIKIGNRPVSFNLVKN